MGIQSKLMALNLPAAVEHALVEHLAMQGVALVPPESDDDADIDMVVYGRSMVQRQAAPDRALRAGIPSLAIDLSRPSRLGSVLRQIRHMLDEPTLYLDPYPVGAFMFHPAEKRLERADGSDIPLTDREVDILAWLSRHRGKTVGRDDLLAKVWRYQPGLDTHTLETHIYRLRQKIEKDADTPEFLKTEEGGYRLSMP